jgi:hypothetical protein
MRFRSGLGSGEVLGNGLTSMSTRLLQSETGDLEVVSAIIETKGNWDREL